jgi:hypothetical protein
MYNFIENIKRLLYWIPIIWKDRDWDYYHLFNITYHKLDRMENDKGYSRYLVRGNRYKRQIAHCKLLLKLIKDFDHFKDDEIDEKYGKAEFSFIETNDPNLTEMKVTRVKLTDDNMEQYIKDLQDNMLKNEQDYNKLFDRLAKHMKKYHRNWWN